MKMTIGLALFTLAVGCGPADPDRPDIPFVPVHVDTATDTTPTDTGTVSTGDPFAALLWYEHSLDDGWIGAGQPSMDRLDQAFDVGMQVITLRTLDEEPFDEVAAAAAMGTTIIRFPALVDIVSDPVHREALYDIYDEQRDLGGEVYLHCGTGNRVGVTWALYNAERLGMGADEALALGLEVGINCTPSENLLREILGLELLPWEYDDEWEM